LTLQRPHAQPNRPPFEGMLTTRPDIAGPYDDKIRVLSESPRPRPLRLSYKAKFLSLVAFLPPLVLVALVANNERHNPTPGITIESLLIVFLVLEIVLGGSIWFRPFLKHKPLVSQGDMAVGCITKMLQTRGYPYARYVFETSRGERLTGMGMACRVDLSPGMKVPVFYNQDFPERQVALCASFYDVVLPLRR
jgi:hypothetical protein